MVNRPTLDRGAQDIVDAIAKFRVAFLRENMKPPETIILADHHEGMRLLSYLTRLLDVER